VAVAATFSLAATLSGMSFMCAGASAGYLHKLYWPIVFTSAASSSVIFLDNMTWSIWLYHLSALCCGLNAGINIWLSVEGHEGTVFEHPLLVLVPPPAWVIFMVGAGAILAACASDWVWDAQLQVETKQLCNEFTGSLRDARSSNVEDKARIMAEIAASGSEEEVEHAVDVLFRAGMSTSCLRYATVRGSDVRGGGRWSLGYCLAVLLVWVVHPITHVVLDTSCAGNSRYIPCLKVLEGFAWASLFAWRAPDQRSFMTNSAAKLAVTPYLLIWCLWVLRARMLGQTMERQHCVPDCIGALVLGPVMLALAIAGIAGTASVPVVGPRLVTTVLAGASVAFAPVSELAKERTQALASGLTKGGRRR